MASSCVTSSTCSSMEEGELAAMMEQRKRKRMISNRESARRSRMRKQKHLEDLITMVRQLSEEKQQIVANLDMTAQNYAAMETVNSILRAQAVELAHRLQSLTEILAFLNPCDGVEDACNSYNGDGVAGGGGFFCADPIEVGGGGDGFFNPLKMGLCRSQPLMASAHVFEEY
ncbi:bZIP transcription factor 11-like [Cucurbita maxima]|uniref:BZIP transcription factor 11-like n=1 Tax=Cucurbita maxima TaxID=3661 RepID=A0A6J1L3G9_CUCMA|nr:bZIP transcription factor 11-like [Cucurbita maxima]